ncbi:LPXTG cell wall anchor domain-containing protein [Actinocrispum sp. NPDC049592]|uniref:LPXTG cell wall anchor domain-containing protein n=1 Tax=Actinocrispum sp. NPDC049592 TaxID=3154835 RepID=UPI00343A0438
MRKWAALLGAVTIAGMGIAVAWADPPAGTLGTLTIVPASGLDTTAPVVQTSAGCSADSDQYYAKVYGPGGFANGLMATFGSSDVGFSATAPFPVQFGNNMKDIATDNSTTVQAGTYTVEVSCIDSFSQQVKGTFTTKMYFTDAQHYQSTPPGGGGTSTTSTSTTSTPSTSTTSSSTSSTTTTEGSTTTETTSTQTTTPANNENISVAVNNQKLANTGSPVDSLLLLGIALLMLGAYILYTTRTRKVYEPTPWPED